MRIGIFTECYHPTMNGVVVSVDTFKKDIEKNGHEVFIFTSSTRNFKDEGDGIKPDHIFRYPSTTLFGPNDYPIGLPILARSITKKALSLNLDIIHAQHSLGMISATALKIAHLLNIPIVHTYHTLLEEYIHWKFGKSLGKWYVKTMSTRYCNRCDQIITPSSSMKKIAEKYGVKTPIEVIPTGTNLADFQNPFSRDELYEKWKVPKEKKLLLYLSRVAKEKNIDFMLEGIKNMSEKRQDFHLIMVGGGKELPLYQAKVQKMKLGEIITFTDKQPKEVANRFFGGADIYIFPSITETQGIVITEAMAAGMPSVAVGIMGPTDIIKDGVDGFLTSLKIDEFTGKIEKLLADESLRLKMGSQAKQNAEAFSTENCAKKMENLYERLITTNNHRTQPEFAESN